MDEHIFHTLYILTKDQNYGMSYRSQLERVYHWIILNANLNIFYWTILNSSWQFYSCSFSSNALTWTDF